MVPVGKQRRCFSTLGIRADYVDAHVYSKDTGYNQDKGLSKCSNLSLVSIIFVVKSAQVPRVEKQHLCLCVYISNAEHYL